MPISIPEVRSGGGGAAASGANHAAPDVFLHVQTRRAGKIKG